MSRTPRAWPRPDGGGGASAPTSRSPSGPPSRVGATPQQARVRPPSRPPLWGNPPPTPGSPPHPGRHLGARPQSAVRRWLKQTSLELVQQVRPQDRGTGAVPAPQIAQSLRTLGVIAGQQTLDPSSRKRHGGRNLGTRVPLGQKPDRLKVPRRGHIRAGPILLLQS